MIIVIDEAAEMTKEMWAYLDTVVKGKVMDKEKEIVWTNEMGFMGFMPPVRRTEGQTICRYECQLTEYKAEIEQLRNNQSILITSFRINMMRLRPDYTHEEFDRDIAYILTEKSDA